MLTTSNITLRLCMARIFIPFRISLIMEERLLFSENIISLSIQHKMIFCISFLVIVIRELLSVTWKLFPNIVEKYIGRMLIQFSLSQQYKLRYPSVIASVKEIKYFVLVGLWGLTAYLFVGSAS